MHEIFANCGATGNEAIPSFYIVSFTGSRAGGGSPRTSDGHGGAGESWRESCFHLSGCECSPLSNRVFNENIIQNLLCVKTKCVQSKKGTSYKVMIQK